MSSGVTFVAAAQFAEIQVSLFAAGALFGEDQVSLFVAVAICCEIWNGRRSATGCIFKLAHARER